MPPLENQDAHAISAGNVHEVSTAFSAFIIDYGFRSNFISGFELDW